MLGMARRRRRNVDVKDADVGLIELKLDPLKFYVSVGAEGDVDGGVVNGMVDEERQPSTSSTPNFVDESVAWD